MLKHDFYYFDFLKKIKEITKLKISKKYFERKFSGIFFFHFGKNSSSKTNMTRIDKCEYSIVFLFYMTLVCQFNKKTENDFVPSNQSGYTLFISIFINHYFYTIYFGYSLIQLYFKRKDFIITSNTKIHFEWI